MSRSSPLGTPYVSSLTVAPPSMTKKFVAESERLEGHTHVLLITTGSVASIKAPLIVSELLRVSNYPTED